MHKNIQVAFQWSQNAPLLAEMDAKGYRLQYASLTRLFAEYVKIHDYDSVIAGGLAVYGWMPTIFRGVNRDAWAGHSALVEKIRDAKTWDSISSHLTADAMELISDSVVGTSKFLHFLNPAVMPIWDSRIARVFGYRYYAAYAEVGAFLQYGNAIHEALNASVAPPSRFAQFAGNDTTPLRRLEFMLFLFGGTLPTKPAVDF